MGEPLTLIPIDFKTENPAQEAGFVCTPERILPKESQWENP